MDVTEDDATNIVHFLLQVLRTIQNEKLKKENRVEQNKNC